MKTSPKRSYSVIENERFELVFAKTGSIISGTAVNELLLISVADPACHFNADPDGSYHEFLLVLRILLVILMQIRILHFTLNPFFVFRKFFPRSFKSDRGLKIFHALKKSVGLKVDRIEEGRAASESFH